MNARELLDPLTEYKNGYYLHIDAKLTETSTGITLKESARSAEMIKNSQTMSFVGIPKEFKPGLPMKFEVRIKSSSSVGTIISSSLLPILLLMISCFND